MAKNHQPFEDDGRTIVSMNVEGMPWYKPPREERAGAAQMTRSETRQAIFAALKAALAMVTAISVALVLFLLFCTEVWFQ